MSKANLVTAISALAAALAEEGLQGVTISVACAGSTTVVNNVVAEEKEEAAQPTGRRGRGAAKDYAEKEEVKTEDKEEEKEDKPAGRGRRGAAKEETKDEEPKGRRGRGAAKKENPVNDTPEQAAIRERLIEDFRTLADHDEAIDDVTEALQRTGASNIKEVGSDQLEQLDADIGEIFDKYEI